MSRITIDLLRKSAEHNEGQLQNLEEITLHQREIIKIENLEQCCRHLKILYLQNNIIDKLENLSKLKELEYLNIALNNISLIEGLRGCESLKKLDLTVNFIDIPDLEESIINLQANEQLVELYLTGNPCQDWAGYRKFVVASLTQLQALDGVEITHTERIQAIQEYDSLILDLYSAAIEREKQNEIKKQEYLLQAEIDKANGIPEKDQKKPYTKEVRREMYLDQAEQKKNKENAKNPEPRQEKKESPMFKPNGEIRQCNEGKYAFRLNEYLDTSLVEVNLDPHWISVRAKGKLTQLKLQEEILVEKSEVKRSPATGMLCVDMKKLETNEWLKQIQNSAYNLLSYHRKEAAQNDRMKKQKSEEEQKQARLMLCDKIESKYAAGQGIALSVDHTTFDDIPDLE